jgi:predicted ArsR family transcriptional regulator
VRIALYEELADGGGAMTATELGKRISETPATCSFHLRQLAKYGFVEEAGGGKGRARPSRLTSFGWNIPAAHDPETQIAGDAVLRLSRERAFARYQRCQETKPGYPREWRGRPTTAPTSLTWPRKS